MEYNISINTLSGNPTKWANTLKHFVSKLPMNCLNVFDRFVRLALKGLMSIFLLSHQNIYIVNDMMITLITPENNTHYILSPPINILV